MLPGRADCGRFDSLNFVPSMSKISKVMSRSVLKEQKLEMHNTIKVAVIINIFLTKAMTQETTSTFLGPLLEF